MGDTSHRRGHATYLAIAYLTIRDDFAAMSFGPLRQFAPSVAVAPASFTAAARKLHCSRVIVTRWRLAGEIMAACEMMRNPPAERSAAMARNLHWLRHL
jgi:hypothetical protein